MLTYIDFYIVFDSNIEVDPTSEEEVSIEQPVEETPEIPDETGQEVIQTMMVTLPMAPEPHRSESRNRFMNT